MSKFREVISEGQEFAVTCEFVPGRGPTGKTIEEAIEFGEGVVAAGLPVHAVSTTCNPGGNPAISPDVLGIELQTTGIEALIHFSCTDPNRNMIESRASALARSGLKNLLVVTGDYPVGGYAGRARPVFDLGCVQAIRYLEEMNAGLEVPGRKRGSVDRLPATDFFVGCAVSPFKRHESELMPQFYKLEKKIAAGADFVVTQLGYDMRKFAEVLKYMRYRGLDVPVLGNVYTLSRTVARMMNRGAIHGCVVTDELLAKIEEEANAEDKGKSARLERSAQLAAAFKGLKFNGIHIGGFGLKCKDVEFIIRRAEEIGDNWRDFLPNFQYSQHDEFYAFPEDPEMTSDESKLVPVKSGQRYRKSLNFRTNLLVHALLFEEGALGFRLMTRFYRFLEGRKFLSEVMYFFERQIKRLLFDCRECGDCGLVDLSYLCPMSKCAKFQRNGPCGGSHDRMCEADEKKRCVWTRVYERSAAADNLDYLRLEYVPPVDCALARTSSWANFYVGRDHTSKKLAAKRAESAS